MIDNFLCLMKTVPLAFTNNSQFVNCSNEDHDGNHLVLLEFAN